MADEEESEFQELCKQHGAELRVYRRPKDKARWQLSAQAQKCWADGHCPGTDFVLHTDSDCIFIEPVGPEDYMVSGKPVMLYESYQRLGDTPWKSVTEACLKRTVEFEFMRRHPQVNPVCVFPAFRNHLEQLHGQEFTKFVESRRPTFPWGFSEHNAIGAFAYYSPQWHDLYSWHDVSVNGTPKEKLMQFWSHSGVDTPQEISHGGRYTPSQYVRMMLNH